MSGARLRFYVKKMARFGCTYATGMPPVRQLRRLAGGDCVRVLTYHRFGALPHDPFCVEPREFAAQVKLLADEGRAISLEQLQRYVAGDARLPPDACLITIDDGMLSTLTEALPVLQRFGVPAVAFVSAALVGRAAAEGEPERFLTWDELRELGRSGLVAIGSHAHTHRSMALMPLPEAREEMAQSRRMLSDQLGLEVTSFAYPFGTVTDFNAGTDAALADSGYRIAFSSIHGAVRPGMAPISLPRVKVEGGEPLGMFSLISRGGMDAWQAVDNSLWRLQRVRAEIS
jgi:peptidoglycan/xylan/chitin deacetylase (PgdA/CDA1 family)